MTVKVSVKGNWRASWGTGPLPSGAGALGTITRNGADAGALLLMRTGYYFQGNAGALRRLPQRKIREAIRTAGRDAYWPAGPGKSA